MTLVGKKGANPKQFEEQPKLGSVKRIIETTAQLGEEKKNCVDFGNLPQDVVMRVIVPFFRNSDIKNFRLSSKILFKLSKNEWKKRRILHYKKIRKDFKKIIFLKKKSELLKHLTILVPNKTNDIGAKHPFYYIPPPSCSFFKTKKDRLRAGMPILPLIEVLKGWAGGEIDRRILTILKKIAKIDPERIIEYEDEILVLYEDYYEEVPAVYMSNTCNSLQICLKRFYKSLSSVVKIANAVSISFLKKNKNEEMLDLNNLNVYFRFKPPNYEIEYNLNKLINQGNLKDFKGCLGIFALLDNRYNRIKKLIIKLFIKLIDIKNKKAIKKSCPKDCIFCLWTVLFKILVFRTDRIEMKLGSFGHLLEKLIQSYYRFNSIDSYKFIRNGLEFAETQKDQLLKVHYNKYGVPKHFSQLNIDFGTHCNMELEKVLKTFIQQKNEEKKQN